MLKINISFITSTGKQEDGNNKHSSSLDVVSRQHFSESEYFINLQR